MRAFLRWLGDLFAFRQTLELDRRHDEYRRAANALAVVYDAFEEGPSDGLEELLREKLTAFRNARADYLGRI